jgi:chromosome segregation ATPase
VVVAAPEGPAGPERLLAGGARSVTVVGARGQVPEGVEVCEGIPQLPGEDGTVDLVACIEAFGRLAADERPRLLREAYRVLAPGGLFAAWVHDDGGGGFWELEEQLTATFGRAFMIAQMPWQGFSLAPVLDDDRGSTELCLAEGLLAQAPEATHYLGIAFRETAPADLVRRLARECVLVPVPERLDAAAKSDAAEGRETARADTGIDDLRARADAAELRVVALEAELDALRDDEQEMTELDELRAAYIDAQAEGAEAQARATMVAERLEARTVELREAADELARVREEIEGSAAQTKAERVRTEEVRAELSAAQESQRQARARVDELTAEITQLRADNREAEARAVEVRQQLAEASGASRGSATRLEELETRLRTKENDLQVLTASARDLEQSLMRVTERAEARGRDLEAQQDRAKELQVRVTALATERDTLSHQVEVALAEREGARQLLSRVEAELDQARRKLGELQDRLATKVEEASRLSGEVQGLRERLEHQQSLLDHSRTRAEELSANAAKQDEQGRMLAEVAIDRDRLREELTRRAQHIQKLEDRVWTTKDEVQRERIENVRLAGELERLKEQSERSREVEAAVTKQLEQMAGEFRQLEVTRREIEGRLVSREQEIERIRREAEALSSESADVEALQRELQDRSREIGELQAQLQQARAREHEAQALAKRREVQLSEAGTELERARRAMEEREGVSGALQSELDVKALEVEQLAASVANLQAQVEAGRHERAQIEQAKQELQRRIEEAAGEQEVLRRSLRSRDQELQDVVSLNETSGVELYKLRRELETAAHANEQLEEALRGNEDGSALGDLDTYGWPEEAVEEIASLRGQLAAQSRRMVEQAEQAAQARADDNAPVSTDRRRLAAMRLEAQVRAEEQEYLLGLLEGAEQKIWEMNDASDRNAARLAASLAQLEKHKEMLDEVHEELELNRRLLSAAQARALEQERLLASERAKMARAGIGADGFRPGGGGGGEVDDLFADLDERSGLHRLSEPGAPQIAVADRTSSREGDPSAAASGPRMVVEAIEDDEAWPDEDELILDETGPRVVAKTSASRREQVDEPTQPRAKIPRPPATGPRIKPAPMVPTLKAVPGGGDLDGGEGADS